MVGLITNTTGVFDHSGATSSYDYASATTSVHFTSYQSTVFMAKRWNNIYAGATTTVQPPSIQNLIIIKD